MLNRLHHRVMFLSAFLAIVTLFVSVLCPSRIFAALSNDSTATVTSFEISDEAVGATDVTYTLEFTLSDPIAPNGDKVYMDFDLNRVTFSGGDQYSNMGDTPTGTFGSFQYNDVGNTWVDIDIGDAAYFHKEISSEGYLIWGLGYQSINDDRHGIQDTIPADKTVRLIITGVTNPSKYGSYALSVEAFDFGTDNYMLSLPYNDPERSVRHSIGEYCAKLKVLKPTGSNDGMTGVDFFISSSIAPSISGKWGISTETDYAGAVYLYADSFNGIDHCPSGAGEAINAQVMMPYGYVNTLHYLNPNQVTLTLDTDKDKYFPTETALRMTVASKTITGTVLYSNNDVGVSSATVSTFKMNGSGYFQTTTDSDGKYTLLVGGGDWGVMPQSQGNGDWAYGSGPTNLKFINDSSVESKTVNFEVDRASSTIRCRILKPDGTPVSDQDGYGVGAFSMQGSGGNGQSAGAGVYNIRVPAGSYNINIMAPFNSTYGAPTMDPVTVKEDETKDIGDITLVAKDATITGSLKVAGVGISNISINANKRNGNGWASATTDASGNFTIPVIAGEWMVMPMLGADSNYAMVDPPQDVSVASGASASVNLTLQSASATINGSLVDGDGNPASVYGYAFAEQQGGGMFGPGGMGGSIERGNFSFKVPAGSYTINAGLAPGSPYTQGDGKNVTIIDGATENVTLVVKTNDSVISGSILDEVGGAITGTNLFVFANSGVNGRNAFQQGTVNDDGTYTISVSSGDWILGYFIDPSSGYMSSPPNPDDKFTITSGQTVTKNITLRAANSTITGTVLKADGVTPETGAFISVDQRGGGAESSEGKGFFNGAQTNQNGVYTVKISSGSYKVRVNIQPGTGYISPPEETVVVAANETSTKNFTLRESNATVTGKITLGGVETMAFVYAWADDGGFAQSMSGFNGNYSLDVSSGTTWHVGGGYETGTNAYRSEETAVTPANGSSSTVNLALVKSDYDLPQSLTVQFDATKPKVIELTDGTELNIPANALASSGNVTLNVNPKTSLPSKKGDRPIWYGYEFSATDATSQTITSFNSDITISFPYTDAQLVKLGITADQLVPSYWDTTTGSWKQVSNVTIDTTNHMVVITTDHFTDYALTANYTVTTSSSNTNNTTSSSSNTTSGSAGPSVCGDQPPTKAPNLFRIDRYQKSAKLYFAPAGNPVSYYTISYSDKGAQEKYGTSFDQGSSGGVLTYTINELKPGVIYWFKIRAGNGCSPGPWSNWLSTKGGKVVATLVDKLTLKAIKSTTKTPTPISETSQTNPVISPAPVSDTPPVSEPTPTEAPKRSFWDKIKNLLGF